MKPKRRGQGLMVSEFISHCHGILKDPESGITPRVILKYGKNHDGYWDGKNVAESAVKAYEVFNKMHENCIPLFVFDNRSNHRKVAEDARNLNKLNLKGKAVPKLKDGFYFDKRK